METAAKVDLPEKPDEREPGERGKSCSTKFQFLPLASKVIGTVQIFMRNFRFLKLVPSRVSEP